LNPAYQNPERRGRAGITHGDRDDQDGERLIKHTDIHLRIRTLSAEAGRESRTATETIKMEKGPVFEICDLSTVKVGSPRFDGWAHQVGCHVKLINCYVALFDNQLLGSECTESPVPHGCTSSAE
jgi:hypothetical protein